MQFYANDCMTGEMLTPNSYECNSTLTSGSRRIYPPLHIDVDELGHCFRSGSPLMFFPRATGQLNPIRKNWGMIGRHQVHSKWFLGVSFTGDCELIFLEMDYLKGPLNNKGR